MALKIVECHSQEHIFISYRSFFLKVRCYRWRFLFTGTPENIWSIFLHISMLPYFPFVSASVTSADWIHLGGSIVVWMVWMQNPLIQSVDCVRDLSICRFWYLGGAGFWNLSLSRADCICLLSRHFWCLVIIVNILKYFYYIHTQMKREARWEG